MKRTCFLIFAVLALSILAQVSSAQGQVWQETRITADGSYPSTPKMWGESVWWRDARSYLSGYDEIRAWTPSGGETILTQVPRHSALEARYEDKVVYRTDINSADLYLYDPAHGTTTITAAAGSQYGADLYQDTVVYEDHSGPLSQVMIWDEAHGSRAVCPSNSNQTKPKIFGDTVVFQDDRTGTLDTWKWDASGGAVDLGWGCSPTVYDGRVVSWQPASYWSDSQGTHLANGYLWQWTAGGGKVNLASHQYYDISSMEMWGNLVVMEYSGGSSSNVLAWDPIHGLNRVNHTAGDAWSPSAYGNQVAWRGGNNIYLSTIPEPSGILPVASLLMMLGMVVRVARANRRIQ